jgi:hypothetical protein
MTAAMPMTRARRVALVLGFPVALAIIAGFAYNAVAQTFQVGYHVYLSVPVSGGRTRVSIDNAAATIRPGPGSRIVLNGTLRASLDRPEFSWRPTAAGLALHSSCTLGYSGSCAMSYDITVPGGLPATVADENGDLTASGLSGQVALSDGSGDLAASALSGTISLGEGSGDITASGLSGGTVRLTDDSGDIVVNGLAGTDVTGGDDSGDITLTFTEVPERVDVTDSSGDITLILPSGPAAYQVRASSASGLVSDTVKRQSSAPHVIIADAGSGNVAIGY